MENVTRQYCRDFWNPEAEIWEAGVLTCEHCLERWVGIVLIRLITVHCPHCGQATRKKVEEMDDYSFSE